jgi:Ca2+-binding EF-hand superfamily protein
MSRASRFSVAGKPTHRTAGSMVFEQFDKDSSGTIDPMELQQSCFDLLQPINMAELAQVCLKLDPSGSGKISKETFKSWWMGANRWQAIPLSVEAMQV